MHNVVIARRTQCLTKSPPQLAARPPFEEAVNLDHIFQGTRLYEDLEHNMTCTRNFFIGRAANKSDHRWS